MFTLVLLSAIGAPPLEAHDALNWVNRTRAAKGLPPFKRDKKLTVAAKRAARFRAGRGIEGHTASDFQFIPRGGHAACAGCAAWPLRGPFGKMWGSCETYSTSYRYAGAAWVKCRGKRYMHAFYAR